ncbi:MAG: serine/threonine-protein kinase, partial [Leptolyngbya sp.]|nr:serine/threonine-protein kinase [Leptolyngbya sp.]
MEEVEQGGLQLGGRYRPLRQLSSGGFGQTWLAEDTHRFQELCVLREFNPQVQGKVALDQAQMLFEREASLLYQLDHPHIPRFRELLREGDRLFLVQDYVEGPTYRQVLTRRQRQGEQLSEAEVLPMLAQVLPVLQYLHGLGLVHCDISPDNLVQRNADGRAVLIDFGSVKQLLVNVRHQMGVPQPYRSPSGTITHLGHAGYIPKTQEQTGQVSPADDLYALGMTAIVLLTGKEPQELYDERKKTWVWANQVEVSDRLRQTLDQMVNQDPAQRPQTASQVMGMLNLANPYGISSEDNPSLPVRIQATVPPPDAHPAAAMASPSRRLPSPIPGGYPGHASNPLADGEFAPTYTVLPPRSASPRRGMRAGYWPVLAGLALVLGMTTGLGWWLDPLGWRTSEAGNPQTPTVNEAEQARQQALRNRAVALGVDWAYLVGLTDQFFFEQHPNRQGNPLTDQPRDAKLREDWDTIATAHLDRLEAHLSPEARSKLGRYSPVDQDRWRRQVNERHVSRKALEDLAKARFEVMFPSRGQSGFVETPVDQVLMALTQDRVTAITNGEALTDLRFEPDRFDQLTTGTLSPGDGHIYLVNLRQGQRMRLYLQAPPESTRLSLYLPRPTPELPHLLAHATETTWAGELPQSGYYEIVVISQAQVSTPFALNVGVDTVTDTTP